MMGFIVTDARVRQEAADLAADARNLLLELDRDVPAAAASGECHPPLDIIETAAAIEIVMDLPGVSPESVRVALRRNAVVIVGIKPAPGANAEARFHLAERGFGRVARAVRVTGTVDGRRGQASIAGGVLRIVLPRVTDRRGALIPLVVRHG
jgi:HSP20 family protein